MVDVVPFALKGWRIPQCEDERRLRNDGMAILDSAAVYRTHSPNVTVETCSYQQDGIGYQRRVVKTPVGSITSIHRPLGGPQVERTTWLVEPPFKSVNDYAVLEFMMRDRHHEPCYDTYEAAVAGMGDEALFKTGAPGCSLHTVIYSLMGPERFAIEWAERQDRVLQLCGVMEINEEVIYDIVARSPALLVQCGGNYAPEMLGLERFVEHVLPHWDAVAAVLHEGGKQLGCHLDANNAIWAEQVGAAPLDWIEAFTPAPDTDMSLAQARAAWPGKTLFINFPSSIHLQPAHEIAAATRQLLRQATPGDRFVIGITENVPEHRWRESFRTILDTLNHEGRLPLSS
jgi:hypothetical protein